MTTCADLIEQTRRRLMGTTRDPMGQLAAAISDDTTTTLTMDHMPSTVQAGAVLAIDLELLYVWDVASNTVTVERGFGGSTAAAHVDGSRVYVNPRFSAFSILEAINVELDQLCSPDDGLYAVTSSEVTFQAAITTYDATGTAAGDSYTGPSVNSVLRVSCSVPGPSKDWPELRRWKVHYDADTTNFPSGVSVQLRGDAPVPGQNLQITYATDFVHLAALSDNVATTGLSSKCYDLPGLGAAMILAGGLEVGRNFAQAQGDTRRAQEVPPNAQRAGYAVWAAERARRVRAEASRLASSYPPRRQV